MKKLVAAAAGRCCRLAAIHSALADTTLHVMSWQPAYVAGTPYWDKTVAGFEAENPGVKVESNFVAFSQYLPTLTAMIAGDSLPDVFNGGTKTGELGRAGLLVNYKDVFDDAFFDQFFKGPLRQYTFDGKPYGLADMAQDFGVFANDRIMKEVGLTVPNTWDELIADAPKFKAAGYIPLAWGNLTRNTCPDFFLPLVAQYGGDVYALDDHTAPGVSWDSKPVVDALGLLERLAKAGVFPPASTASTTLRAISSPIRAAPPCSLADRGPRASSPRTAARTGSTTTPSTRCRRVTPDGDPLHRRRRGRGLVGQRQQPEQGPRGQVHRLHLPSRTSTTGAPRVCSRSRRSRAPSIRSTIRRFAR